LFVLLGNKTEMERVCIAAVEAAADTDELTSDVEDFQAGQGKGKRIKKRRLLSDSLDKEEGDKVSKHINQIGRTMLATHSLTGGGGGRSNATRDDAAAVTKPALDPVKISEILGG
jgi:hypothetical protein